MTPYPQVLVELFARQAHKGMKLGLDRVRALLDALGAPDARYRSILVAGTNGKGSTCAFAEALLRSAGVRTALYTSPHLCRFTERARVMDQEIPRERVSELYERALRAAERVGVEPTFFELTTAMALCHFSDENVELAVLEVGLGGRLDATNATEPVVCGLAPVDLDHMALLGPTVVDIAREKAGILRPGRVAWSAPQGPEVHAVLREEAAKRGAELHFLDENDAVTLPLSLSGPHQRLNAALALKLVHAAGVHPDPVQTARALATTRWPGRYEWWTASRPPVLLDGAHNAHGAAGLGRAMAQDERLRSATRVVWLMAASNGRDAGELVPPVMAAGARGPDAVVATQARVATAVKAETVAEQLRARGLQAVRVGGAVPQALSAAQGLAGEGGAVVAWGSLYALGEVRAALTGEELDATSLAG
ncbi:MAG: bifunctional folylpolyglutamate synthase/dihydrofolate synthase [Myxococcota bacterium]